MKKSFAVLLMILFLLIACTGRPNETPVAEVPSAAPATETPEPHIVTVTPQPIDAPTPMPTPTDTPVPTPTPSPTPVPTPTPEPVPYTIIWLADTQNYVYLRPEALSSVVDYAIKEKDEMNIVAVVQSGDLVENNALDKEWEGIRDRFEPLRGVIPFYCVAGNHDLGIGVSAYNKSKPGYEQYIKYALCDANEPDQIFRDGECWYQFFEREQFLLVGIGMKVGKEEQGQGEWLGEVLDRYSEYPVFILTHEFLYNNGIPTGNVGNWIEQEVIAKHPNVRLLFCGHHKGVKRWTKTYEEDRTFTAIMYNLQSEEKAYGYCTILTFDPMAHTLSFTSYSPYFDDYNYYPKTDIETFVLENAF